MLIISQGRYDVGRYDVGRMHEWKLVLGGRVAVLERPLGNLRKLQCCD